MNVESTKLSATVRALPNEKKPEAQKKVFVEPELKHWGSVEKVTGFTF